MLFGEVNPSGRLAETFPLELEHTPAYLDFPGEHDTVRYGEGIFIGYRWYEARQLPVQFPFGHGLSYTSFAYGPVELSSGRLDARRQPFAFASRSRTSATAPAARSSSSTCTTAARRSGGRPRS